MPNSWIWNDITSIYGFRTGCGISYVFDVADIAFVKDTIQSLAMTDLTQSELTAIVDPDADLDEYVSVARSLATRSRTDVSVRISLSTPDVLRGLVSRLEQLPKERQDIEPELLTLRCVGNGCASNPDAVKTIIDGSLKWIERYTVAECEQQLRTTFAKVLYNITGADFTHDDGTEAINPAWRASYEAQVHAWLIEELTIRIMEWNSEPAAGALHDTSIELLIDMLFWISSSAKEEDEALGSKTRELMLRQLRRACDQSRETEQLATLIESVVSLCRVRATKAELAEDDSAFGLFDLLETVQQRITRLKDQDAQDDIALLLPQASSLTWILSDVSAEEKFAASPMTRLRHPLVSHCLETLESMTDQTEEQLLIASCLVLGNSLLNMPDDCTDSVVKGGQLIDNISSRVLSPAASPDLLYATAGMLRNCCRSVYAQDLLGTKDNVIAVVEKLCKTEAPEIRESGTRLMRSLARGNFNNQNRLAGLAQFVAASTAAQSTGAG